MTPAGHCRRKTREAGSSFYYPLLLLPAPKRRAMYALYAFCREVDDIADGGLSREQAREALHQWREELARTFTRQAPQHPVTRELLLAHKAFDLPPAPFFRILEGMEMDLERTRYHTLAELEGYCARVAVAVGEVAVRIFGLPGPGGERFAHHLGLAFQFTNILRDVAEDARMGRVYLPTELLAHHGADPTQVLAGRFTPPLQAAMGELGQLAAAHYRQADAIARRELRTPLRPALLMAGIYRAYLHLMERRGFDVFSQPLRLPPWHKVWITLNTLCRECLLSCRP